MAIGRTTSNEPSRAGSQSTESGSTINQKPKRANHLNVEDLEKDHSEVPTFEEGEIDHVRILICSPPTSPHLTAT